MTGKKYCRDSRRLPSPPILHPSNRRAVVGRNGPSLRKKISTEKMRRINAQRTQAATSHNVACHTLAHYSAAAHNNNRSCRVTHNTLTHYSTTVYTCSCVHAYAPRHTCIRTHTSKDSTTQQGKTIREAHTTVTQHAQAAAQCSNIVKSLTNTQQAKQQHTHAEGEARHTRQQEIQQQHTQAQQERHTHRERHNTHTHIQQ